MERIYDDNYIDDLKQLENLTIVRLRDLTRDWDDGWKKFVKEARVNSPEDREDKAKFLYRTSIINGGKTGEIQRYQSMILNLRDSELDRIIRSFY